jgi:hypothetical protein
MKDENGDGKSQQSDCGFVDMKIWKQKRMKKRSKAIWWRRDPGGRRFH